MQEMVRHDVHFHEHSRATLGIQNFKTWISGELVQWLARCNRMGWFTRLSHASTCSRESNQHFHETTNATRIAQ